MVHPLTSTCCRCRATNFVGQEGTGHVRACVACTLRHGGRWRCVTYPFRVLRHFLFHDFGPVVDGQHHVVHAALDTNKAGPRSHDRSAEYEKTLATQRVASTHKRSARARRPCAQGQHRRARATRALAPRQAACTHACRPICTGSTCGQDTNWCTHTTRVHYVRKLNATGLRT